MVQLLSIEDIYYLHTLHCVQLPLDRRNSYLRALHCVQLPLSRRNSYLRALHCSSTPLEPTMSLGFMNDGTHNESWVQVNRIHTKPQVMQMEPMLLGEKHKFPQCLIFGLALIPNVRNLWFHPKRFTC